MKANGRRQMLINGQRAEELRVAILVGGVLENYQVETAAGALTRGNIYRGVVAGVQPSLNAAFIDFGAGKHGFLAGQDIVPHAYHRKPKGDKRPSVDQVLERGKSVLVQVTKDAIGTKGAALTTKVSLAGRYLVLTPYDASRGLSRKIEDGQERTKLKERAAQLKLPDGIGYIIRTNAEGQSKAALQRDVNALVRLWRSVEKEALKGRGPRLLYSDQDVIVRALRDYLDSTVDEVLIDDPATFEKAQAYVSAFMPRSKVGLTAYTERLPLFSRFHLEEQIEAIYRRKVQLPSGGSIVLDATEALTAIDVNSGKATKGSNPEETATNTNLEAAAEVARHLRLRDIGGLVVVDFIDMRSRKNQRKVESALRDAMKSDKARVSIGRISGNGLLEINRQRIQQPLAERTHRVCPTCKGVGSLPSPELVGLNLLRRIEARAVSSHLARVRVKLHPELADAVQNQRRREIVSLEEEFDLRIEIVAATHLHRANEEIDWEAGTAPRRPPRPPEPAATVTDLATEEPAPIEESEPGSAAADGDAGDGASGGGAASAGSARSGRRRGRRGGRRRRRNAERPASAATDGAGRPEPATQSAAEPAAAPGPDAAAGSDGKPADTTEAKSESGRSRRRRRGRRSGRGGAKSDATAAPAGETSAPREPSAAAQPQTKAETPAAPAAAAAPADAAAKPTAARRRRSRRGTKTDAAAPAEPASAAKTEPASAAKAEPAAAPEKAPAKKRAPRKRAAKAPAEPAADKTKATAKTTGAKAKATKTTATKSTTTTKAKTTKAKAAKPKATKSTTTKAKAAKPKAAKSTTTKAKATKTKAAKSTTTKAKATKTSAAKSTTTTKAKATKTKTAKSTTTKAKATKTSASAKKATPRKRATKKSSGDG